MALNQHSPKLAYSIREAMHASSLGKTKMYELINQGKLQAVRIGGRTVIPAESLQALISGDDVRVGRGDAQ
ncbi:MAG: helix-turn-helix domain-containing protein [Proteobacteria bacterium]|nr:helix-turn-helix domain-containing protein [Pseudomonadota bacterium]